MSIVRAALSNFQLKSPTTQFALDVRNGLETAGQKTIPSTYLYDGIGSALFEAITLLPEYGLTRADERLLQTHAHAVKESMPPPAFIVELGSGSGRKTRHILRAMNRGGKPLYYPVDVSAGALQLCKEELSSVATVVPLENTYLDGLAEVTARRRPGQKVLVLFLGSTIGNFDPESRATFLAGVRAALQPGDALLLGTDLVKPEQQMLAAYDDPIGVTAAFNLNLLARINRELGGDFRIRRFAHEARYNTEHRRIEMHLRSMEDQIVHIAALDLPVRLLAGETIWTESSHKFVAAELADVARDAGFEPEHQWLDREWRFAENFWRAAGPE
ncbi:MAG TPA: L-histidine N(alpha)-methyltransferase [Bryobacteraceae bacterium]|nr:L-histidine N(alpha)-methyltransferase [Bryobacteraceae bacterium]